MKYLTSAWIIGLLISGLSLDPSKTVTTRMVFEKVE